MSGLAHFLPKHSITGSNYVLTTIKLHYGSLGSRPKSVFSTVFRGADACSKSHLKSLDDAIN